MSIKANVSFTTHKTVDIDHHEACNIAIALIRSVYELPEDPIIKEGKLYDEGDRRRIEDRFIRDATDTDEEGIRMIGTLSRQCSAASKKRAGM
jgi:hypothetical protein